MPKVHTFVVLAYKESKDLERCIESVLNQKYKSEVLIATSTPNDFINNVAKKYKLKIKVNKESKHRIGDDFDFGIKCADTELVTVAHQDDIYNENYLEEISKLYEKYNDFSIAFGNYREIKNGEIIPLTKNLKIKKFLLSSLKKNNKSRRAKRNALKLGSSICCPCVTVNKKVLGDKPYRTELKCDLDWDSWYQFSKLDNPFAYVDKEIMCHRIHEESTTSSLIENNIRLEEDYQMFCKFWPKPIAKFLMHFYKNAIKTNG